MLRIDEVSLMTSSAQITGTKQHSLFFSFFLKFGL